MIEAIALYAPWMYIGLYLLIGYVVGIIWFRYDKSKVDNPGGQLFLVTVGWPMLVIVLPFCVLIWFFDWSARTLGGAEESADNSDYY